MIYDIAQQQPELDFMQTPVEPVSFDVLDWPYPALRLTVVSKPGTKDWGGLPDVVSFSPTVELGQLLTNVPKLASTTIYKVVAREISLHIPKDDPAIEDTELLRDVIKGVADHTVTGYLTTLEDAEKLLENYGLTSTNAASMLHMVRMAYAYQDSHLKNRSPQGEYEYGLDVIKKAFGDYDYERIEPLQMAWPVRYEQDRKEQYVDLRSLLTLMAIYEHAGQRGNKLPPLPSPKVSLVIDEEGLKGVLYDVGETQIVSLKAENADKLHADNIRKIERLRKQINDTMNGAMTAITPMSDSFYTQPAPVPSYYALHTDATAAYNALEYAELDIEEGTVKVPDVAAYLQKYKDDVTQAEQRLFSMERQIRDMQTALIAAYVAVVEALEKEREKVLYGYMLLPKRVQDVQVLENRLQEAKGQFTRMPSNVMDMYSLFSALPDTSSISTEVDDVNEKVVIVRPGLKEPHTQLSLKYSGEIDKVDAVIQAAQDLGVMGGYMAMAYRAVFALYDQKGGLSGGSPKMVTITMNELFQEMYGVTSFPKGISKAVRGQFAPQHIFWGLMHLLQRINFEVPGRVKGKKDWITGIFPMQRRSAAHETDARNIYVDLMLNNHLFEDMTGGNGRSVRFKLSKNKPMRDYHHRRRNTSCAMQFVLETMHRINLHHTKNNESIIAYDTMSMGMLAHKMGMVLGKNVREQRLIDQINSSLDELKEHDVISKWRLLPGTGTSDNPLSRRLHIESGSGYVLQRELTQARDELQKVRNTIENPLRRHKPEAVEEAETKPASKGTRGRPKKTTT